MTLASMVSRCSASCLTSLLVPRTGQSELGDWLLAAGVSEHRLAGLLLLLDNEEVDSVGHLHIFSRTAAFDELLKATTAMLIRDALAAEESGAADEDELEEGGAAEHLTSAAAVRAAPAEDVPEQCSSPVASALHSDADDPSPAPTPNTPPQPQPPLQPQPPPQPPPPVDVPRSATPQASPLPTPLAVTFAPKEPATGQFPLYDPMETGLDSQLSSFDDPANDLGPLDLDLGDDEPPRFATGSLTAEEQARIEAEELDELARLEEEERAQLLAMQHWEQHPVEARPPERSDRLSV